MPYKMRQFGTNQGDQSQVMSSFSLYLMRMRLMNKILMACLRYLQTLHIVAFDLAQLNHLYFAQ